jgi:P-type Ca2+ transporter type 2C
MSSAERASALANARVVARVQPDVKLELVDLLRTGGRIVGMTGDGVNDAPALQRADVGVALAGAKGSDVARESADIVVTDDDLATVVEAVREGRRIYSNASSVIRYLLTGNISEIVVVLVGLALFSELTVPLLPIQLPWVNLMTDGLPAITLALDRPPGDPLAVGPRDPQDRLLTFSRQVHLAARGVSVGAIVLFSALLARELGWDEEEVRTQLLVSLVSCHLALVYVSRSEGFAFARGWADNRVLLASVGGSILVQAAMLSIEPGRTFLSIDTLFRARSHHIVCKRNQPVQRMTRRLALGASLLSTRQRIYWPASRNIASWSRSPPAVAFSRRMLSWSRTSNSAAGVCTPSRWIASCSPSVGSW